MIISNMKLRKMFYLSFSFIFLLGLGHLYFFDLSVWQSYGVVQSESIHVWDPFNNTNPNIDWCPLAKCHNSPLCTPCKRRFLLLLATGRSGSTTILKMLNFLPNVRLSGENNNQLYVASELIRNLNGTNGHQILNRSDRDVTDGAWLHNAVPESAMSCLMQNVLYTINPPPYLIQHNKSISIEDFDKDTIIGAKMIRMHKGNWGAAEAASFITENFPCSKVVINIRSDPVSQVQSQVSQFNHTKNTEGTILQYNRFLGKLQQILGTKVAYTIDMMDWSGKSENAKGVEVLNSLVEWLGFENCRFKSIVHENHDGLGRDSETDIGLKSNCRLRF